MSKKIQYKIPQPCHENWQKMTSVEQGKFCTACQKTVVDFSLMSDPEIILHISKSSGNICGRFMPEQLGRDINISEEKKILTWKYAWNILLALFLSSSEAGAQTETKLGKIQVIHKRVEPEQAIKRIPDIDKVNQIRQATVVDAEDSTAISFASIMLPGEKRGLAADINGKFYLDDGLIEGDTIIVSAVGYQPRTIIVTTMMGSVNFPLIQLHKSVELMGDIAVIGYNAERRSAIAGGLSVIYKNTIFETIKDTLVNAFANNSIRIFPNPVAKGSVLHLQLAVKEQGDYSLQIVNAKGQIVKKEIFSIQMKNQLKQLFIQNDYPGGVYFIRMENCLTKKSHVNRFIIQ